MYRPRYIIFVLVLSASVVPTYSQLRGATEQCQVSGQIRLSQGGGPVNEVIVRLEALGSGPVGEVRTDRLGKFRFEHLSPIQYRLVIRHPGFKEIQREVNLVMVSSEYVQIQLVADSSSRSDAPSTAKSIDANVPADAQKEFEKADASLLNASRKEQFEEGARHLEKALAMYPGFTDAQFRLGVVYMDLQEWTKAESALKKTIQLRPKAANAFFALGDLYLKQKKYDDAEKSLRSGLAIEDRSWQGHFALGRVYWSKGELVKAGTQVGMNIQLKPDFPDAYLLAGNILLRANKRDDALENFQTYLRLAPNGEFAQQARESVKKLQDTPVKK